MKTLASCQAYCLAFEEELTVPLTYLSLFITPSINCHIKFVTLPVKTGSGRTD